MTNQESDATDETDTSDTAGIGGVNGQELMRRTIQSQLPNNAIKAKQRLPRTPKKYLLLSATSVASVASVFPFVSDDQRLGRALTTCSPERSPSASGNHG